MLASEVQVVRALLTDQRDVDRAAALLAQAQRMTTDGLVDSRRAIQALRDDPTQLDEQISALAETHRARHHTGTDLTIDGDPRPVTAETTVALTRIAQEALVNAAKHAPQQPVRIVLAYPEENVQLTISNPLPGPTSHTAGPTLGSVGGGYGLTGMEIL